jgi:hypothetical protein
VEALEVFRHTVDLLQASRLPEPGFLGIADQDSIPGATQKQLLSFRRFILVPRTMLSELSMKYGMRESGGMASSTSST